MRLWIISRTKGTLSPVVGKINIRCPFLDNPVATCVDDCKRGYEIPPQVAEKSRGHASPQVGMIVKGCNYLCPVVATPLFTSVP